MREDSWGGRFELRRVLKREHRKGRVEEGREWWFGGKRRGKPKTGVRFPFRAPSPLTVKIFYMLIRSQILLNCVSEAEQQVLSGCVPERRRKVEHLCRDGTVPAFSYLRFLPIPHTALKCDLPVSTYPFLWKQKTRRGLGNLERRTLFDA